MDNNMAIVAEEREYLLGTEKIKFDSIIDEAARMHDSFTNYTLDWTADKPSMYMDKDANLCFRSYGRKNAKKVDVTKYALGQAASYWKIPSSYLISLYDKGLNSLAIENIDTLNAHNKANDRNMHGRVMVSDGVAEAVVSERFAQNFPVCDVLDTIRTNIDTSRYIPNQVFLSKSKMHIRFVDFDHKVKVGGEDMSVGFTCDSSDVGKSALKVNFFLYKFACRNGIVMVGKSNAGGRMAGTLYRQKHLGEAFDSDSIDRFIRCFDDIEILRQDGLDMIAQAQGRMMSEAEMTRIIDTCKKNYCSVDDTEKAKILELAADRYGRTKWGLINGITEVAQNHTLDDRIAYETWAGNILQFVA